MQNPFDHFWLFVLSFGDHLFTLLAGCVATVLIAILEKRILKRPISLKIEIGVLAVFVLFACYQAWHDQYKLATAAQTPPQPPPNVQVNVPPQSAPQVIMIDRDGSPTVAGYLQIANIQPVKDMQRIAEGRDIGMNVFFQNPGPVPVQDFQNASSITVGVEKDEAKIEAAFEKYRREQREIARRHGLLGETIGNSSSPLVHFNSAYLRNLSGDDAAHILDGSKKLYLQVWASWRDSNGHVGTLKYCSWLQNPSIDLPAGGLVFHSCAVKGK